MAELRFDISQLFGVAFGAGFAASIKFDTAAQSEAPAEINFPEIGAVAETEETVVSYLGTPVLFPVKFKAGTYQFYDNGEIVEREVAEWQLPFSTVVEFNRAKLLTRTTVGGGKGSIKETYGHDDWQIRIRGIMIHPEDDALPEEDFRRAMEFDEIADVIGVEGKWFEMAGIYQIALEQIALPAMPGFPWCRAFEWRGYSDEPVELIL